MRQVVRVVVSCTDRKRLAPRPDLQLRTYPDELTSRAAAWLARLDAVASPPVPAGELYQGEHWSVVRRLEPAGAAVGSRVEVWIVSAGYGLLRPDELIEPLRSHIRHARRGFSDSARQHFGPFVRRSLMVAQPLEATSSSRVADHRGCSGGNRSLRAARCGRVGCLRPCALYAIY